MSAAGASSAPGRPAAKGREIIPDLFQGKATEHAARIAKVNPRYISDAKRISETRPGQLGK